MFNDGMMEPEVQDLAKDSSTLGVTLREIRQTAKGLSASKKLKVFSDICDEIQLEEYNEILSNKDKYEIIKEDSGWKVSAGRNEKYTMLVWYYEVDYEKMNEEIVRLSEVYDFDRTSVNEALVASAKNYKRLLYNSKDGGKDGKKSTTTRSKPNRSNRTGKGSVNNKK